jgi:guanine nucleotide-binding protein subunit beta-2-like 1 protein
VGDLKGHFDWVTAIETGHPQKENEDTQVLITASRDKTILIWKVNQGGKINEFGEPVKCLTGHSHFISDLALTNDNNHLISSSWDKELRLWDLRNGTALRFFNDGHTSEIHSCAISTDGRYILSVGADKVIKLWNVKGECKHTVKENLHKDWVTKVRYIPVGKKSSAAGQFFATVGWDGYLKIWNNQSFSIKDSLRVHDGTIEALTVSPRGNFIVTGGKDMKVRVFDFTDVEKALPTHDTKAPITALAFNPKCHWVAIGTEAGWELWDFESKDNAVIAKHEDYKVEKPTQAENSKTVTTTATKYYSVTSIAWNTLGSRLFVGYNNGHIKVWDIIQEQAN